MCGILGYANNTDIRAGIKRLAHRGPDGNGVWHDHIVTLGHTRLAILDLTAAGAQPMHYARKGRKVSITYNGEIYNFEHIRDALTKKGYSFKTGTDTEVILAAYLEYGEECVTQFNGMWAFGIYDATRRVLFCSRDRFGIKPLYYTTKGTFAFSSEIQALPHDKTLDYDGIGQYFTYRYTTGETTLLKHIRKLLPGHHLTYHLDTKTIRVRPYYHLAPRTPPKNKKQAITELREHIATSVKRRMRADVPVATLLSGGIDSSIVSFEAKKHNPHLHTYSIGFHTTNELPYARRMSEHINSTHHEYLFPQEHLLTYLNKMIDHIDEPIGDPGFLPILYLSEQISKHNKVVLSGDGADELLLGYDRYKLFHYGRYARHFALGSSDVMKRLQAMKGKSEPGRYHAAIQLFTDDELSLLGINPLPNEHWSGTGLDAARAFDFKTLLPNDFFMKADKMSSAYGLEQRVPFMDHELVEYACSLPHKWLISMFDEKKLLKSAYRDTLPKEITTRKKHGFNVPIDDWFKHELGDLLRRLLSTRTHNLYRKEPVLDLLTRIQQQGTNYKQNFFLAQKLWSILVFELWHKKVIA